MVKASNRSDDLANELAQKNKLVDKVPDLQRAVKEVLKYSRYSSTCSLTTSGIRKLAVPTSVCRRGLDSWYNAVETVALSNDP